MKKFVAIRSSDGALFIITAPTAVDAYHVFGRDVEKMAEPIDTGDVDIDLTEIDEHTAAAVQAIGGSDGP